MNFYTNHKDIKPLLSDKERLRNIALKIDKIPIRYQNIEGGLDLDKVNHLLTKYQRNHLLPRI